jgi:xanthine dehydrogenase accessory factor
MLFADRLVVVRGGGDLGTGAVYRLHTAGFPVVVLELAEPLAIRREVAVSTAVDTGAAEVDGMAARLVSSVAEATAVATTGVIAVLVAPELPPGLVPYAIVDARLAKQPLDTRRGQASVVVGLGPGFIAARDCDAVVETRRGHDLGRVLWSGRAAADTGVPGTVGGESARRVVRAPLTGSVDWEVAIGDRVEAGAALGRVNGATVSTEIPGVVRGLIAPGRTVAAGIKIADIDPRADAAACFSISDKALAVGGGVVEAVLTLLGTTG